MSKTIVVGLCLLAVVASPMVFGGVSVYDQNHLASCGGELSSGKIPVAEDYLANFPFGSGITVEYSSQTSLFGASAVKDNSVTHMTLETGSAHASCELFFVSDYVPDFSIAGIVESGAKVHIELEDRSTGDMWERTVTPMVFSSFDFDDFDRLETPGDFRLLMDVFVDSRVAGMRIAEVSADFGDVLVEVVPVPVPGSLLLAGFGMAFMRRIKKFA
jgi:hypothetical protein